MKHLKLTAASQRELRGWQPGSGRAFISNGTRDITTSYDFRLFIAADGMVRLALGNAKVIKLDAEQSKIAEPYASAGCD